MAQFGPGAQLAAQCPSVPTPDGWRPWVDTDGPIPVALTNRAQALAADPSAPLGTTESYPLPGVAVLIRVEPHVWGRDTQGTLVEGCFRTAIAYLPAAGTAPPTGVTPPSTGSGLAQAVGILTVVSLTVGTVATLAAWGSR
jgi:hypothetical protein